MKSYILLDALSSSSSSCMCSRYSLLLQTTNVSNGGSGTKSDNTKIIKTKHASIKMNQSWKYREKVVFKVKKKIISWQFIKEHKIHAIWPEILLGSMQSKNIGSNMKIKSYMELIWTILEYHVNLYPNKL